MKISVIIPVYNVEKYLPRCVESVLNQTYKNLEIILVDDGSPDNCPQICDEYAKKDSRIKVIHKKNAGASSARNAGLKTATGEYISFIDSDDWVECDMIEKMIAPITELSFDIIMCGLIFEKNDGTKEVRQFNKTTENITATKKDKVLDLFCELRSNLEHWTELHSVWNKLYNRNLLNNEIFFDTNIILEDYPFNLKCFDKANTLCILNNFFYHYSMENPNSITRQKQESQERLLKKTESHIIEIEKTYNFCKKNNLPQKILIPLAKFEIVSDIDRFRKGIIDTEHSGILKKYRKFISFKMILCSKNLKEAIKLLLLKLNFQIPLVQSLKKYHANRTT